MSALLSSGPRIAGGKITDVSFFFGGVGGGSFY